MSNDVASLRNAFGERLRFLRGLAEMTQAELAERSGISLEHFSKLERGAASPSFSSICALAAALHTEPANLFLHGGQVCDLPEHPTSSGADLEWARYLSGVGLWSFDPASQKFEWSGESLRLLGLGGDGESGLEAVLARVHPGDAQRVRMAWEGELEGAPGRPMQFRLQLQGGKERLVIRTCEADESGLLRGALVDVTERRRLEESLASTRAGLEDMVNRRTRDLHRTVAALNEEIAGHRETEGALRRTTDLFNAVMEGVNEVIWVRDLTDGRILHVNPACERILGRSVRSMLEAPETFMEAFHPGDREPLREAIRRLREEGSPLRMDARIIPPEGGVRHVRLRGYPVRGGDTPMVVGLAEDVTDEHLRQEQFRLLVENIREVFWVVEPDLSVSYVSPAILDMFAMDPAEILADGMRFLDRVHPEDREKVVRAMRRQWEQDGEDFNVTYRVVRPDGQAWIWSRTYPVRDESGNIQRLVGLAEDVTEQVEREQAIRRESEEARKASQAGREYLAQTSHEVRNLLSGMLSGLELVQARDLEPETLADVRRAVESGRDLTRVLGDVLDFSRLEAGHLDLAREPFDPSALARDAMRLVEGAAEAAGLEIEAGFEPGLPDCVEGDPLRVRQILLNLLNNAVKYAAPGTAVLRLGSDGGGGLRFVVEDDGPGMDPELLQAVLSPYARGGSGIQPGAGLGLTICVKLAEAMGGWLSLSSEPGGGTWAEVALPLPARCGKSLAEEEEAAAIRPLRLLLVEDNPVNLLAAQRTLEGQGHEVLPAADGLEALRLLAAEDVDLVVMDLQMPRLDGLEVTRRIRAGEEGVRDPDVPVVALTAHVFEDDRDSCLEAGMNAFLTKPVDWSAFNKTVAGLVSG
ncbi:PAS domain-containing protein [Desulfohalovibrio reitneri]|uniref:PAS domain-containing protein n=1 Tax=Desulfohalovibrio reitneri TaxID=1307759 RepID=UPI0004A6D04D|nr:PAS domain-containing protein [Desulfohalovibrio reitneri]